MSKSDVSATRDQLLELYNQKHYRDALDLLEREWERFPQPGLMYHWKMCLAARAGEPATAIQAFREALDQGHWYPERLVREDEDLQSLQGVPEYEELVALSLKRYAAAEASAKPELLVVPPEVTTSSLMPVLIGLHGNSQTARLAADNWSELRKRGWLLALPQSSQPLTSDAYMWDDFEKGANEVQRLCSRLLDEYNIDPERILVGGFSAGGGLAIQLAVSGALKARGFIVVGPYLRNLDVLTPFLPEARAKAVKGYIIMGQKEPVEGQELMQQTAGFLQEHGIVCELEPHPDLAHAFPPDFGASLDRALALLLPG
jgi:predicted esterase